jgi:KDO2-lipid IV(A) lauroyltransferase
MESAEHRLPEGALSPRWWPTWVLVGALALVGRLPCRVRVRLGRWLGTVLRLCMARRRHIARSNLALCFPRASRERRERLLSAHFQELGIGLVDTAAAWTVPGPVLDAMVHYRGLENVSRALENGRGAIFMAAHLTSLEMSMQLVSRYQPAHSIYRRNKNPVLDHVIFKGRSRQGAVMFDREDMRTLLGALRSNHVVWFSPDQDHGLTQGGFVEFFSQPAATVTTTARIAARTGAALLPLLYRRLPGCKGYEFEVLPALEDFPGDDVLAATRRLNRIIEHQVRLAPAQYLWVHRRFKTRPPGMEEVYGA